MPPDHRPGLPLPADFTPETQTALSLLLQAYEYAHTLGQDVWEFAVEIRELQAACVTRAELRWLVCKGYAEHAVEARRKEKPGRSFRRLTSLEFSEKTCFILTEAGATLARLVGHGQPRNPSIRGGMSSPTTQEREGSEVPRWDSARREL